MNLKIEKILEEHLKEAHKIYNFYIVNSYSNFEEKKISFKDFYNNYKEVTNNKLPYLVALNNEQVVGIAYLKKFRDKSGYRFAFENTVYVHHDYIKNGIGSKLLKKLLIFSKKNKLKL